MRIGLTDLILFEILQGVESETLAKSLTYELLKFEVFETGGVRLARASAANYRKLRSRGWTIRRGIDCLIATFCLTHDYALLHCDRDFEPFERVLGLKVIRPGSPEA
jgi:hypothetical protein